MTNQYYVFLHPTTPGAAYSHEAILKRGLGNGEFKPLSWGYGNGPDEALKRLNLEYWNVGDVTFVREDRA